MAESIKFTNKYVDTTGIYDSALQTTQAELNSKAVTVDLTSASIGTPNPVNADTLGGDPASDFFKSAMVVNNFTTTASGYALDARAGKSLNDSLSNLIKTTTVTGTTDASGNVGSISTATTIILSAFPDRSVYVHAYFALITTNAGGTSYMLHIEDADGNAVANQAVKVKVFYVTK